MTAHRRRRPGRMAVARAVSALVVTGTVLAPLAARPAHAACCYFAAKDKDVTQPAQKAFITWDPARRSRASPSSPSSRATPQDFGMVIPTPGRPKLDEMPRDFFKELAVFTILKKRDAPGSSY